MRLRLNARTLQSLSRYGNVVMKVLVLGGTGAMGVHLVNLLDRNDVDVFATSRSCRESKGGIRYLRGNAHDRAFMKTTLKEKWDAIVDFMNYSTPNFVSRFDHLINATSHYIYLSSGRVYANSQELLTEDSPRLLDVSKNADFLASDEYSLAKARQENHLINSEQKNWTIIRPYITYSSDRLQLGELEKEQWLYRALRGRTIVFSNDVHSKMTTLTYGYDVSRAIWALLNSPQAMGSIYNIICGKAVAWSQILDVYMDALETHLGYRPKVKLLDQESSQTLCKSRYKLLYDRLYDRVFDNTKVSRCINVDTFTNVDVGLKKCLEGFLENPKFKRIDWKREALADRIAEERTPLHEIHGMKQKVRYLRHRYLR